MLWVLDPGYELPPYAATSRLFVDVEQITDIVFALD